MREELEQSLNEASQREMDADFSVHGRGYHRRTEFLKSTCTFLDNDDQLKEVIHGRNPNNSNEKRFILRYLQNPVELLGNERVSGVKV